MVQVVSEGFGRSDLELQPFDEFPELSPEVQQTLARLLGWFPSAKRFQRLICDTDGRLLVTTGASKTNVGNVSNVNVPNADTILLADNPNRRSYVIYNHGSVDLLLGFGVAPIAVFGFPVMPGTYFADDTFTGILHGLSLSGSVDTRILEF